MALVPPPQLHSIDELSGDDMWLSETVTIGAIVPLKIHRRLCLLFRSVLRFEVFSPSLQRKFTLFSGLVSASSSL
ncbi:unnamed protein product [Microthlaspi erraticum]|uniref:Uncharacterized protein n=1 Tax=Microthlaspi erraticum TaxID=1685480 RepID=A0A6D2HIJ3_9BRAS|nr:unnamed protein product [Microthlaspi erraticum]